MRVVHYTLKMYCRLHSTLLVNVKRTRLAFKPFLVGPVWVESWNIHVWQFVKTNREAAQQHHFGKIKDGRQLVQFLL